MGLGTATKLSQPDWPYPSTQVIIGGFKFPPFPQTGDLVCEEGENTTPLKMSALKASLSLLSS